MREWRGHRPETCKVLLRLLRKAGRDAHSVSKNERVLFIACEFWAAANNRTLGEHLGEEAITQLQEAEESFAIIGLADIASIVRLGYLDLTNAKPKVSLTDLALHIEDALTCTDERVDESIAHFACERI
jgi:hypothetical protein